MLESYAQHALEGKKTKTLKLPHGKMSFKKQQSIITTTDETKAWLLKNKPELINTKIEQNIKMTYLKKDMFVNDSNVMYLEVGNVHMEVPGVTITERPDKFEIK